MHHVDESRHDPRLESIGQVWLEALDRLGQPAHVGDQDGDALLFPAEVPRTGPAVPETPLTGIGLARRIPACCRARPRGRRGGAIELRPALGSERERFGQTTGRLTLGSADGALEVLDGAQQIPARSARAAWVSLASRRC